METLLPDGVPDVVGDSSIRHESRKRTLHRPNGQRQAISRFHSSLSAPMPTEVTTGSSPNAHPPACNLYHNAVSYTETCPSIPFHNSIISRAFSVGRLANANPDHPCKQCHQSPHTHTQKREFKVSNLNLWISFKELPYPHSAYLYTVMRVQKKLKFANPNAVANGSFS